MRFFLTILLLALFSVVKSQSVLPINSLAYPQPMFSGNNKIIIDSSRDKKWFLNTYTSISTGFNFFNGGSAFFLSAPVGLQLSRKLNNNLYAFAGISAAPAYMNFNNTFLSADINKMYPGNNYLRTNNFGIYSRAEMGLMYVNDAKTFSISGSIGIERSSNPLFLNQPVNTVKTNSPVFQNR